MKRSRFIVRLAFGSLLLAGFAGSAASAATDTKDTAKSKTATSSKTDSTTIPNQSNSSGLKGYASDSALQIGTIVQLTGKDAKQVGVASQKNLQLMYGAVIDPHQLSLTISDASVKNETFVATSGTYNVLVSTQGGTIQSGDYVTLSAIDGVAMKADVSQKTVFGRAASGFDGKTNGMGTATLKTTGGSTTKTVSIGLIPVAINIQKNPIEKSTKANLPNVLQRIGLAIAEHPVGPLRIYLSVAISVTSLGIALVMLYAGVRNSVISIGRNPLSRKSILRGLVSVVLLSFIVVIIGIFAVYLLLKL